MPEPESDADPPEQAAFDACPEEEAPAAAGKKVQSPLLLAMLHVKWACFMQKAKQHEKAVEHFSASLALAPSARAHFGRGTCLAALRRRQEAVEALQEAVALKPSMVAARVNLAGALLALRRFPEAEEQCRSALELQPGSREAVMNLANALRNLGRREEAVAMVWQQILAEEGKRPAPVVCSEWRAGERGPLVVVCVKWGTRYGADYVNCLHAAVGRWLPGARFVCFTDDSAGLREGVEARSLPGGLTLWWGKAYLFSEEAGLDGSRVLFLDLDQVVVGDIKGLAGYAGAFALLSTDGIACELAGGGYNSSVMAWEASAFFRPLYAELTPAVLKYVHRFDHWLEMMVQGAELWQRLLPGQVIDYTTTFLGGVCVGAAEADEGSFAEPSSEAVEGLGEELPSEAVVVTFPRCPKPHEVVERHAWVRQHWLLEAAESPAG